MLKKGQIKFSRKAEAIVKPYFKSKKVVNFLTVIKADEQKPKGSKDFYKNFLGKKQDISAKLRIYSLDLAKSIRLFLHNLLKEKRTLNAVYSFKNSCILYITKNEIPKFDKFKIKGSTWPIIVLDDENSSATAEFTRKMNKNTAVDLVDLIFELQS